MTSQRVKLVRFFFSLSLLDVIFRVLYCYYLLIYLLNFCRCLALMIVGCQCAVNQILTHSLTHKASQFKVLLYLPPFGRNSKRSACEVCDILYAIKSSTINRSFAGSGSPARIQYELIAVAMAEMKAIMTAGNGNFLMDKIS